MPASRPHTTPFTLPFLFLKDNTSTWFCPSCTQLSSLQQRAQQWMTGFIFQDKEDKVRGTVLLRWLFMAALLAQSSLVNQRDGQAQNILASQTFHQRCTSADPQGMILVSPSQPYPSNCMMNPLNFLPSGEFLFSHREFSAQM